MQKVDKILMVPVGDLHLSDSTARVHPREQIEALKRSLLAFGFVVPLLIDRTLTVSSGRAVLQAAVELGEQTVPCVMAEWFTPEQCRAFALAHDRLAEMSEWDRNGVSCELLKLQDLGFDFTLTGFDDGDIILEESTDVQEDDYLPELSAQPRARRGQIYQLGSHRLMCGDATVPADVEALMAGAQVQLFLTDPPYNVDYTGGPDNERAGIANDALAESEYEGLLRAALTNALTVLEPGAAYYLWHADGEPGRMVRNACHCVGLPVRQCLIWVKQSATMGRQDYQWQHEPCLHGETEAETAALECGDTWDDHQACLYGWKDGRAHLWRSDRRQTTILEYDRPTKSAEHPTMKPVRLFAYQVANSTLPGAAVLDLFAGSGTTAIACEQLGRVTYMMELDPGNVDVIIDRWEKFTGQKAVLLNGT